MIDQRDELQEYLDKVTPLFRELFGIAHAITDQYDAAEYALQQAIQRGSTTRRKRRISFKEQMRQSVIRISIEQQKQNTRQRDGEGTWFGFDTVNVAGNPFLQEAVREPLHMRRILMLRYGAGLPVRVIAGIVGLDKNRARGYLQQFEARVERRLKKSGSSYEKIARRSALQELRRVDADVPDAASTFRQLQADLGENVRQNTKPLTPVRRLIGMALMSVAILLCVIIFWVFAVLMENGTPPNSAAPEPSGIVTAAPIQ